MARILVTGGAGYIGSHVAHQLVASGHNVIVLDNLYSGFRWAVPQKAQFVLGDVADSGLVKSILTGRDRTNGGGLTDGRPSGVRSVSDKASSDRIDAIIHFAAHIEVGESVTNPLKYYRNNVLGSLELIRTAYENGVKRFVFSSTAAVYGNPPTPLVSEESPIRPINPYGRSKVMVEQILEDLGLASDFRYVALRYFNVAGAQICGAIGQATPRATHLIKVACQAALGKIPSVSILGTDYPTPDGTGIRDYIHVEDLAHAHLLALDYLEADGKSGAFNCGYGHGFSVRQVLDVVKKVSKKSGGKDFSVIEAPPRAGDCAQLVANASRIREVMGWKPRYDDLELICQTALEWERKLIEILERSGSRSDSSSSRF